MATKLVHVLCLLLQSWKNVGVEAKCTFEILLPDTLIKFRASHMHQCVHSSISARTACHCLTFCSQLQSKLSQQGVGLVEAHYVSFSRAYNGVIDHPKSWKTFASVLVRRNRRDFLILHCLYDITGFFLSQYNLLCASFLVHLHCKQFETPYSYLWRSCFRSELTSLR